MGLIVLALWEASPFPLTQMEQSLFSWQGPGESLREAGHLRKAPLGSAATTLVRGKQTQPPGLGSGQEMHPQQGPSAGKWGAARWHTPPESQLQLDSRDSGPYECTDVQNSLYPPPWRSWGAQDWERDLLIHLRQGVIMCVPACAQSLASLTG